jgi:hypothetical protein
MKRMIAAFLLMVPMAASATPYFRLIDPSHLQVSAGFLISPKNPSDTAGVTELALITHSTADGTIIPQSWQSIIPPESWVPLQIGAGGSFSGDAIVDFGTSMNLSPIIANTALRWINSASGGFLQGIKNALMGSQSGQIRIGYALEGKAVQGGTFQSWSGMFPGHGFGQIIGNASRIDTGVGWKF